MGRRLYGHFWDFEFRTGRGMQPGDVARPFSDVFSALSFLRGFIHDPFARASLREVATRSRWDAPLFACSDQEILRQLAWQLATGRLYLVPIERTTDYGPTGVPGGRTTPGGSQADEPSTQPQGADKPSTQPQGPGPSQGAGQSEGPETPAAVDPATPHWIRFQIIDYDTETPVAGVDLHLKMPDGTVSTYTTDAQGLVHLIGVLAGTCDLEQMLNDEALEVIHQT